ncbi:MAG: 2-phosphosulfolactate phosphatase [Bryobacteraceae bacterium]
MPQRLVCLLFAASLPLCFPSPACPANTSDNLPIKRVVLYKNGVGYFEHLGKVHDNQQVAISFTSGQLNDVLKSLTVLDLNGGRITGVAYGSSAPTDRQLDDLHIPTDDKTSLADFLGALRGARLEVRNGTTVITGRLLSVERKTRVAGGTTLEVDYVSLIGDTGELHTTEISPAFSVRLLDHNLTGKVERFLDLVSAAREPDLRQMVVSTAGSALVLPSPNGSALCQAQRGAILAPPYGRGTPTPIAARGAQFCASSLEAANVATLFTACLRNCRAVAAHAHTHGSRIAVIPAGEQWGDDSLRPAIEDLIGAGAVLAHLPGRPSPEAETAIAAFERFQRNLHDALARSTCYRAATVRERLADRAIRRQRRRAAA